MAVVFLTLVLVMVVTSQSEPHFQHLDNSLSNNSYIYYANILEGEAALKCVTDSVDCCTGANVGVWSDEKRRPFQQGEDGASCLFVTRGERVISLNRRHNCVPPTSGLCRCDIPDSTGHTQSLFIYVSNSTSYGTFLQFTFRHTSVTVTVDVMRVCVAGTTKYVSN